MGQFQPNDLTGQRFGRLVAVEHAYKVKSIWFWRFQCDCGREYVANPSPMLQGQTRSCGCLQRELASKRRKSHGASNTPEHRAWVEMRRRCEDPNRPHYPNYGGRGIAVCERWLGPKGFENFLADVGPRPSPAHSLDRIDNDGNYEPGNCRWAESSIQANNRRRTVRVVYLGQEMPLADACRIAGVKYVTAKKRLREGGSVEHALSPMDGRKKRPNPQIGD